MTYDVYDSLFLSFLVSLSVSAIFRAAVLQLSYFYNLNIRLTFYIVVFLLIFSILFISVTLLRKSMHIQDNKKLLLILGSIFSLIIIYVIL